MKSEIKLNSRYGIDNRLIQIDGKLNRYRLSTKYNYRVGFEDDNIEKCTFIDPDGGPFITVGSEIEGHRVRAIYDNGIIEFES